jgi:N-alpha-acetyltransferase 15/16, NatA auxiliary subunit
LRSHPYYVRCARNAIDVYVKLHDDPSLKSPKVDVNGIPDAEARKKAKKAKKAAKKAEEQSQTEQKNGVTDEDPKGEGLVKTEKPLQEAVKFLKPLQELSPKVLETQILSFDVHFRRGTCLRLTFLMEGKYLQALKGLIAANTISPQDAQVKQRAQTLRERLATVEIREELKDVLRGGLEEVERVQNGI